MDSFIQHWKDYSNGKIICKEIDLQKYNNTLTFVKDKHKQIYTFDQKKLEKAMKHAGVLEREDTVSFHMISAADFLEQLQKLSQTRSAYSNKCSTAADVQVSFCKFVGASPIQTNFKESFETLAQDYHFAEYDYNTSKVGFLYQVAWDCFLVSLSKDGKTARVVVATDTD